MPFSTFAWFFLSLPVRLQSVAASGTAWSFNKKMAKAVLRFEDLSLFCYTLRYGNNVVTLLTRTPASLNQMRWLPSVVKLYTNKILQFLTGDAS